MTVSTHTINPSLYKSLPFDFQRDIAPVAGLAELPLVLVVNPRRAGKERHRVRRLRQSQPRQGHFALVWRADHQPSVASSCSRPRPASNSSTCPITGGPPMHHRPDLRPDPGRRRRAAELAAAHQERLDARAGRAVAGADPTRCPTYRPSARSSRDSRSPTWNGVGAPRGTPPEIVERLNREINAGLQDAALLKRYADVGGGADPRHAGRDWRQMIARDIEKWAKVVKAAGLQPE